MEAFKDDRVENRFHICIRVQLVIQAMVTGEPVFVQNASKPLKQVCIERLWKLARYARTKKQGIRHADSCPDVVDIIHSRSCEEKNLTFQSHWPPGRAVPVPGC